MSPTIQNAARGFGRDLVVPNRGGNHTCGVPSRINPETNRLRRGRSGGGSSLCYASTPHVWRASGSLRAPTGCLALVVVTSGPAFPISRREIWE